MVAGALMNPNFQIPSGRGQVATEQVHSAAVLFPKSQPLPLVPPHRGVIVQDAKTIAPQVDAWGHPYVAEVLAPALTPTSRHSLAT